ncbi:MAG: DUF1127 domain-containing protein [Boseongicola sp.]
MSTQVKTTPLYAPRSRQTSVTAWLLAALANRRSRSDLLSLEPHMLNDVGLTSAEAISEGKRPVWDVPGHWMR